MQVQLILKPGNYYAGINRPWYASQEAVRSEVQSTLGLTGIRFYPRKTPLPVDPKKDPRYSDDWDEWIAARYDGPSKTVDVERLWSWVVRSNAPASSLPPEQAPAPDQGDGAATGIGLVLALGGVAALAVALTVRANR